MKNFRFFGMALVVVSMCVNFAACSKDNGSDGTGGTNGGDCLSEKKLTKIASQTWTETFSYDDQARLIEAVEISENETNKYTYIWGNDAVVVNKETETVYPDNIVNRSSSYTYRIDNGLVRSADKDGETEIFRYNNSNRLSRIENGGWSDKYNWDEDKLVLINTFTFTYKESCKKGYFPLFVNYISSCPLFTAHPEIAGIRTKQLPATITWTLNDGYGQEKKELTYSYKFDSEGYISTIDMEFNGEERDIYTLTWE